MDLLALGRIQSRRESGFTLLQINFVSIPYIGLISHSGMMSKLHMQARLLHTSHDPPWRFHKAMSPALEQISDVLLVPAAFASLVSSMTDSNNVMSQARTWAGSWVHSLL